MRFRDRLGDGGFRYLMDRGIHYTNAHYLHANTETAVGNATLATGAYPSRHGIIANDWIDRNTGEFVYNIEDDRHHIIGRDPEPHKGVSPRNPLSSTFGDELVINNGGQSRVFSVSGKDRGAILPGGHVGKSFWFSKSSGQFVSSTYYDNDYPRWVADWNERGLADSYRGATWELLNPQSSYIAADIDMVQDQYWFMHPTEEAEKLGVGYIAAIHGSPWEYDTYVPIFFAGYGFLRRFSPAPWGHKTLPRPSPLV